MCRQYTKDLVCFPSPYIVISSFEELINKVGIALHLQTHSRPISIKILTILVSKFLCLLNATVIASKYLLLHHKLL